VAFELAVAICGVGVIELEESPAASARIEVGAFAAHCWPNEVGKYWQEPRIVQTNPGVKSYDGEVLTLSGVFPVVGGVEHSIGTGLTTTVFARQGAAAAARLWGQLAWVRLWAADSIPEHLPYQGSLA